jgi:hypothetical protein
MNQTDALGEVPERLDVLCSVKRRDMVDEEEKGAGCAVDGEENTRESAGWREKRGMYIKGR